MEALIIDDASNGHLIEDFLLNSGIFETCIFHHASIIQEAKEFIPGHYFHFIIIDPSFSKEYGLPLIKTVKDYSPSTKIIAFSLCSTKPCSSECRQQCLEWGADYHLDKVKDFGLLPTIVRKCLSQDLEENYNFNEAVPRRTLHSILGDTFVNHARLKTPTFLRANRCKKWLKHTSYNGGLLCSKRIKKSLHRKLERRRPSNKPRLKR